MGSRMVLLRLICLSEIRYPLRRGCCHQQGTAPCKDMTLALQATGITRRFQGVLAKDHVNFSLERGENGAGKSTLMNVLSDFYQPDEGEICIQDQPAKITRWDDHRSTFVNTNAAAPKSPSDQGGGKETGFLPNIRRAVEWVLFETNR